MGRSFWSLFGGKDTMLFLKILRILNGIFVISVALSAAARIFPIFRNKRTVMVNLFVLGMAGILTSLLFKQFSMVCISLAVSLHQLYTLEMYQRDARLRKMKKSMLRMKRRIDRLERRIGVTGMYESGNALRGIFLTAFVALLLFSSFIFCFHLERPDAMTVEPEMTGYYFYHPDIAVFHPSENNAALTAKDPTAAGSTAGSTSANSMAASSTATGSTDASPGEWWVNFSTLGMLLSSCVCLACICFAEYESHM